MSKTFLARLRSIALVLGAFSPLVAPATAAIAETAPAYREIEIFVEGGYKPANITVKAGERVRLKFVRKEYSGCTRELVIAAFGIRKDLPPNKPVLVDLPPLAPGEYEFRCGMNMVRGSITVVLENRGPSGVG
jgi:plastocyanin domain-containing protein